jgi:3-hydroxyisobutyrate dehydrogenase-like beta-hydroxyacid dehydrogenase
MDDDPRKWRVGLVGYGEVGRILAEDLVKAGVAVAACDLKLDALRAADAADAPLRAHAARHGVRLVESHAALAAQSDFVVSAVTASQAVAAAQACAPGLQDGRFFLDLNSASPGAKKRAAASVERAGGRYVEAAVMTSVPPYRIAVPMLLGGPHAVAIQPRLARLGFSAQIVSDRLGVASATKMCRSVIIKGMEAMFIESLVAARAYGVEDSVLASLAETFPGIDWNRQASYFFQRVIQHGRRRAEEMFEAAETVREAGLEAWSADGTARRQAWVADLAAKGLFDAGAAAAWRERADRILQDLAADAPSKDPATA